MSQLSNATVDWSRVDTVLLDMDGTLLDLNFDTVFWLQVIPRAYARSVERPLDDVIPLLRTAFDAQRGTLSWYDVDYWTRTLGFDVEAVQREYAGNVGWLAGAREFLAALQSDNRAAVLVTNADRKTLAIKDEQTGLIAALDDAVSSHDFGMPKEHPGFWDAFFERYEFARERCLFVDDTISVLRSARDAGIGQVIAIEQPDSSAPARDMAPFDGIVGVRALLPQAAGAASGA